MAIRCAVIGAGFIGIEHLKAYRAWGDAELVAIAEKDATRAEELTRQFGLAVYTDYEKMLANEELDAVSICLPTGLHVAAALTAAHAGKHVLLEKPMARNIAECDAIIAACEKAHVKLMLGFIQRFHPELQFAQRLIADGRLGEILLALDLFSFGEDKPWPGWYYEYELSGGGEMMHDAIHSVDRLAWLIGSPIVEVFGQTSSYARGIERVEDGGVATLKFASGAIASLFINQSTYPLLSEEPPIPDMPGRSEFELHGTRGSLRYNMWRSLQFSSPRESFTFKRGSNSEMSFQVREFLDSIIENRAPSVGGAEGRQGIAVIRALYESERRNAPVQVAEMFASAGPL